MRLRYLAASLLTVVIGLGVHLGGWFIPAAARDVIGDALWATMMLWWISALSPRAPLAVRAGAALAVSWCVEFSQLVQAPMLDAARGTLIGRLVLGSGFDARDLAAYALGVVAGVAIEVVVRRRRKVV